MLKSKARWKLAQIDEQKAQTLATELKISSIVSRLLITRGIDTPDAANKFLYKEKVEYHDPFLLSDMEKAVERIRAAVENNEKILIYGDYDADGVSSTSVMIYTMRQIGADFNYYIPNRFTEGYGPNEAAFRKAKEDGYSLIVSVDTGISAVHETEVAREIGIDFIITDHHEAPPVLPNAYAIVNPKKPGCPYPFKGLAGVGVAFKLAHALLGKPPKELLDIVTIGTVADLVPLVDENRLFVNEGVRALQITKRPGLRALKKICGIDGETLTAEHVGFGIGPRINAAGRLDSADPAVKLLITEDMDEAGMLASEIDSLNKERQTLVNQITEEAIRQVEADFALEDQKVIIVGKANWNAGVIGIVASRLVERYYRPTIVMSFDEEKGLAKGSARSIEGFDMFENLSESRDILPHFGGHPMAAGLTMKIDDVKELKNRLSEQASRILTDEDYIPITKIDLIVKLEDISIDIINEIEQLAPFGVNNPSPKVMLENVKIDQMRKIGSEENHLKIIFSDSDGKLDSIGFHKGYLHDEITSIAKVSAVGKLSINEWNGHSKPQLFLEDLAVGEWQLYDWRSARQARDNILKLPKDKRILVCFQRETVQSLKISDLESEIIYVDDTITDFSNMNHKYLVFLDLPEELGQITQLFGSINELERIYPIFYQQENHFFSSQPNREQFKWYYAFLKKRETFDIQKLGGQLATHKGWAKESIDFMTTVFLELNFVTMNDGMICYNPLPSKKDLQESRTYRIKLEQSKLENIFLYSSYSELKKWFDEALSTSTQATEEQILQS